MLADNNRQSNRQSNPSAPDGADDADKPKEKKKSRTKIGDWVPGGAERDKAIVYWTRNRRGDLCDRIDDIAEHFCAHHGGAGSLKEDWPKTWQTWYMNALKDRPVTGAAPKLAALAGVTIDQWLYRLRAWHLGIPEDSDAPEAPKGFWDKRWGPSPKAGAKIPLEALAEFKRRYPSAA